MGLPTTPFNRVQTSFSKSGFAATSGSTDLLGASYILLSSRLAIGSFPTRLRLYRDEVSRDIDVSRPIGNFNISSSVALITDIVFSGSTRVELNPAIIGTTNVNGRTFWTLEGTSSVVTEVQLTVYPIEPFGESSAERVPLIVSGSSIVPGSYAARGNVASPKSFLILSGSSSVLSRLRLYSQPIESVSTTEISRSFNTQPNSGSFLIVDVMFDSASYPTPFIPILEAYTFQGTNYSQGTNQVGYVLENMSGGTSDITASLYIYRTED